MKTFTVAGFSTLKGIKKMRFANDLVDRVKVLQRNGHTDIELQELPRAMTKDEIRVFFGVVTEAAATPVEDTATEDVTVEDTVEVEEDIGESDTVDEPEEAITYDTLEAALAAVPIREKGRFLSKEVREARARELMQDAEV